MATPTGPQSIVSPIPERPKLSDGQTSHTFGNEDLVHVHITGHMHNLCHHTDMMLLPMPMPSNMCPHSFHNQQVTTPRGVMVPFRRCRWECCRCATINPTGMDRCSFCYHADCGRCVDS